MRILVTGADGMLGADLCEELRPHEVTAAPRAALDITDAAAVRRAVAGQDVVVNTAAFTDVDAAEQNEDAAYRVNADGPRYLAEAARSEGARLIQISTDYVFDGDAAEPYGESATPHPVSAYGRTKAAGERFVRTIHPDGGSIVRTAWLYGRNGGNFAATMLTLAARRQTIDVVTDQRGQPTWTRDLARRLRQLIEGDTAPGIFHGTNSGDASWFEFARAVFAEFDLDAARVLPTDSSRFVKAARRPANSVLAHDAWAAHGFPPMRSWREALHDAVSAGTFDHIVARRRPPRAGLG